MKQVLRHKIEKRSTELLVLTAIIVVGGAVATASSGVLDAGTSISDGLVAEYRFDTGAGDTAYDTAGTNDGSIEGASWTEGIDGKALKFDGNDDGVTVPHQDSQDVDKFTLSFWMRPDSTGSEYRPIFEKSAWSKMGVRLETNSYLMLNLEFDDGTDLTEWEPGYSPPENEWDHITYTYDPELQNENVKLYVNGDLRATTTAGVGKTLASDSGNINIGDNWGSAPYDGKIDDLRLYSESLNESQVSSIYNSGSWRVGTRTGESDTSKVLDMSFQHQNSTHVLDTSGYENHGEPQNGASQETARECKVGRCYSFDGNDDEVYSEASSLAVGSNATFSFWVYRRGSGSTGSFDSVMSMRDNFWIWLDRSSQEVGFESAGSNGDWNPDAVSSDSLDNHEWQHVAVVRENSTDVTFYIDGKKAGEDQTYDSELASDTFYLGSWDGSNHYGDFLIDQVKVFNRSLSQQEIVKKAEGLESSGAVLDMRFDGGGGDNVEDYSGNGNHGVLEPNESYGADRVDGIYGNALRFDGGDEGVDVSDSTSLSPTEEISFGAWLNLEDWDSTATPGHSSHHLYKSGSFGMSTSSDSGQLNGWITDEGSRRYAHGGDVPLNQWVHVMVTYDGSEVRNYINGKVVKTASYSGDIDDSGSGLRIGNAGSFDWGTDGRVSNVVVYPYAVSESKIKQLYSIGSSHIGRKNSSKNSNNNVDLQKGLVLSQTFDRVEECGQSDTLSCPSGMNGEIVVDESGNANHGELNGPTELDADKCRSGRCLQFDDNSVDLSTSESLNVSGNVTFSTWLKMDEYNSNYQQAIDHKWIDNNVFYMGVHKSGAAPRAGFKYSSSDWSFLTGSTNMNDGRWHHLLFKFEGDTGKIYLDGKLEDESTVSNPGLELEAGSTAIGEKTSGGASFLGKLDETRVYNRSLSDDEIWKLYTRARDRSSDGEMAGSVAHWTMDGEEVDTGDGTDGSLTVTSPGQVVNDYVYLTGNESAGSNTIGVNGTNGFSAGDEVLIVQVQEGTSAPVEAGSYEFREISSVSSGELRFSSSLENSYYSGIFADSTEQGGISTQVVRVPQYTDVTVDGGSITAPQWDGRIGGITAFRSTGTVETINGGKINVSGRGFRGGTCGDCGDDWDGGRGEGITGWQMGGGTQNYPDEVSLNNVNGGGGNHVDDNDGGDPGAGGGYGTTGETVGDAQSIYDSEGGSTVGDKKLNKIFFGGGGGGGADDDGWTPQAIGGNGAGMALISASEISGMELYAKGSDGESSCDSAYSGKSGAGAGGTVHLKGYSIDIVEVNATGGEGADDDCDKSNGGEKGGDGGDGRVRIDYTGKTGSSDPSAYSYTLKSHDRSGESTGVVKGDPKWVDGKVGKALEFDGEDDYLDLGDKPEYEFEEGQSFSISFWMNPTQSSSNSGPLGKHYGTEGQKTPWYLFRYRSGNDINWMVRNSDGQDAEIAADMDLLGEWHHVTGIYDASSDELHLYVDGELRNTATSVPTGAYGTNDGILEIGSHSGDYFPGKIDDVRIYPYALSENQVEQVMNDGGVRVGG